MMNPSSCHGMSRSLAVVSIGVIIAAAVVFWTKATPMSVPFTMAIASVLVPAAIITTMRRSLSPREACGAALMAYSILDAFTLFSPLTGLGVLGQILYAVPMGSDAFSNRQWAFTPKQGKLQL